MKVTYDEFVQWRNHAVTRALITDIEDNIADIAAEVMNRSTPNNDRDQFLRGYLKGLVSARDFEPKFVIQETEEVNPNE
jgi:hypothetical protein